MFIYVYKFLPESLSPQNRKPFTLKNLNPFTPICNCIRVRHPIVFWIAMIQFFISLPETGVLDMSVVFILDQMHIDNENDANFMSSLFMVSAAVGLVFGSVYFMPKLSQLFNGDNIKILKVGIMVLIVSFGLLSMLVYIKHIIVIIVSGFCITTGFVAFSAANGIVTKYLNTKEQGIGFGVVFSIRSITWTLAPYSFALLYDKFTKMGFPVFTYLVACFLLIFALLLVMFPLHNALNKAHDNKAQYSMTISNININEMTLNNAIELQSNNKHSLANNIKINKHGKMKFETIDDMDIDIPDDIKNLETQRLSQ